MDSKNFEKAIKVIQKTDKDTQVRIDGSMLYLQEAKPQVIEALKREGFEMALYEGEAQVLQKMRRD